MSKPIMNSMMQGLQFNLEGVDLSLNAMVSLLRRRWPVLAASFVAVMALTLIVLTMIPRQYTATTVLQINTSPEQVMNFNPVTGTLGDVDAGIRTEVDIIKSRSLAKRVIGNLDLIHNPDFAMQGLNPVKSMVSGVKLYVRALMAQGKTSQIPVSDAEMSFAVSRFLKNLTVTMQPRSYTIKLAYVSSSPELSARIMNEVSSAYLNHQLEDQFDSTKRANEWVNGRIKELAQGVQASDLAVQKYREEHGLTQAKGVTLTEQQLSELNSQLILARTQLAEASAKYDRSRQLSASGQGIATASEVINNPLIQNLRQQETEVRRTMSDLAARYGERHPRMITIRNELRDVQRKIYEEHQGQPRQ